MSLNFVKARTNTPSRHKTTSLTFTWLIYLLALYPKMQSRLREEISTGVPQYSYDDADQDLVALLESLPLLNGIYNETLRSFPTVPLSMRAPNKDTVVVGQHIPKGTEIYIIPWATNRCRDRWGQDAHEFRPERWIDATTGNPNNSGGASSNYAIMTFLQGVYMCIGQGFAKAELRALTCHICPCL